MSVVGNFCEPGFDLQTPFDAAVVIGTIVRPTLKDALLAPLTIDLEESCARLGIVVAAGVRNVPGKSFASDALTVIECDRIPGALKALGIAVPLFTPGHRLSRTRSAWGSQRWRP